MRTLVVEWYEHENFSYGFLIPFIFGYLVFQRRDQLLQQRMAPAFLGVVLLITSISIGLIAAALGEPFLSRLSLVATLAALVGVIAGWNIFRLVIFPLAYLLLMVPPPYVIVKQVSYYLKMFDAVVATELLQLIGVPVYRDFYYLNLPNITLEVADVCSGIASLFAMVALGIIYIYFLPVRTGAEFGLMASMVIFPVVANLIRIILVAASVYYYGPIMLEAFFHQFTGTFTFLLSVVMLLVVGEWLRRCCPTAAQLHQHAMPRDERTKLVDKVLSAPILLAALVLSGGLYVLHTITRPDVRGFQGELEIPKELGEFTTVSVNWADPYTDEKAEKSLSRVYQSPRSHPIETFIGYRHTQYGMERLRSPKLVFPRGWEYAAMNRIEMKGNDSGWKIDAIWLLTKKNNLQRLVVFWYQLPDKAFSNDLLLRWEIVRRWAIHGRTDAAVVRLATDLDSSENVDRALQRLIAFSQQITPFVRLLVQGP
jgi:EpsI family protein